MGKHGSDSDPLRALETFLNDFPTYTDAAAFLGISKQFLYALRRGARPIPEHVLGKMGLKRVQRVVSK